MQTLYFTIVIILGKASLLYTVLFSGYQLEVWDTPKGYYLKGLEMIKKLWKKVCATQICVNLASGKTVLSFLCLTYIFLWGLLKFSKLD